MGNKLIMAAVAALALSQAGCRDGGCKPKPKPAIEAPAHLNFSNARKSMASLSKTDAATMFEQQIAAINAFKHRKPVPAEPMSESAASDFRAIGAEFNSMLSSAGPEASARAYSAFLPEIRSFNSSLSSSGRFNHAIDLVNQAMYWSKERAAIDDNLRLGCLLVLLPEMPQMRASAVRADASTFLDDSVYQGVNLGFFFKAFAEGDRRFLRIGQDVSLWADGSRSPLSEQNLKELFESISADMKPK